MDGRKDDAPVGPTDTGPPGNCYNCASGKVRVAASRGVLQVALFSDLDDLVRWQKEIPTKRACVASKYREERLADPSHPACRGGHEGVASDEIGRVLEVEPKTVPLNDQGYGTGNIGLVHVPAGHHETVETMAKIGHLRDFGNVGLVEHANRDKQNGFGQRLHLPDQLRKHGRNAVRMAGENDAHAAGSYQMGLIQCLEERRERRR